MTEATSVSNPEGLNEPGFSFNTVIRQSYASAKKHLQDGITVIKDEFIGIYDKAESYFNIIALPVNNYLKDLTQIEAEFQHEQNKDCMQFNAAVRNGNIVPLDQALKGCMEENY